jgi:hypothetical protein
MNHVRGGIKLTAQAGLRIAGVETTEDGHIGTEAGEAALLLIELEVEGELCTWRSVFFALKAAMVTRSPSTKDDLNRGVDHTPAWREPRTSKSMIIPLRPSTFAVL